MDSPSVPQAPDPNVVAKAQGDANIAAAQATGNMNRVNQITPFGSLTYTNTPGFNGGSAGAGGSGFNSKAYLDANPDVAAAVARGQTTAEQHYNQFGKAEGRSLGVQSPGSAGEFTQTMTLDPRIQNIIDSQLATSAGLQGATQAALGRANDTLGQGIDYGSLPQLGDASSVNANLPGIRSYDPSSLGAMPTADEATRQKVTDAYYNQETSRLDPQFQQSEDQLRSALMNRGMVEGSEGWKNQMDQFGRTKNDAYSTALNTAIQNGGTEMQRDFTMGMQGRQEQSTEQQLASQMDLTRRSQQSAENLQGFNAQNTQHDAALNDEERKRSLVLNELAALRGGQQVNSPQFGPTPQVGAIQPAPIGQATQNAYQGALGVYGSQVGSNNSMLGALGQIGGLGAMTAGGANGWMAALSALMAA